MTAEQEFTPTPFPLALLICGSAITEAGTNKKTLVGIFDRVWAKQFPVNQTMTIYARLTDAQGRYEFRIDYVQVKTDKKLAEGKISEVDIADRLQTSDILMTPPPVLIPEPGQYEFRLWANDRYVGRVKFTAELAKEGSQS